MKHTSSLRLRLTFIILLPLLAVALGVGLWQLNNARLTANEVFDRSLLSAALAITRDVSISGGDALSPDTNNLLKDTSGGPVFYHVYAPDGVIVAGYATPPVGIPTEASFEDGRVFFSATYQGNPVRGLRMQTKTEIDDFSGLFTTTVWQDVSVRASFVRDLMLRSLIAIAGIILSLCLIVWFGIRIGLRPLANLQAAIDLRSGDDLAPIKRAVPVEVSGIVSTLNRLFGQVSDTYRAKNEFISNAAHQLRNPIAAMLSLSESVRSAQSMEQATSRAEDLVEAAKDASALAHKLLAHERASATLPDTSKQIFSLNQLAAEISDEFQPRLGDISLTFTPSQHDTDVVGDKTMMREAINNIIDNALVHGGDGLTHIDIAIDAAADKLRLIISDDGKGMHKDQVPAALERFSQISDGKGSGLGLAIVEATALAHQGSLELIPFDNGLRVIIKLPKAKKR